MLSQVQLKALLHSSEAASRLDKLLLLLACETQKCMRVAALKQLAVLNGLREVLRWNVSAILRSSRGAAILTPDGWELSARGQGRVRAIASMARLHLDSVDVPRSEEPPPKVVQAAAAKQRTVLLLAVNPTDMDRLRVDEELRKIEQGLERARLRDRFRIVPKLAVTDDDLRRAMLDNSPEIVHFAGHGLGPAGIAFQGAEGRSHPIAADALGRLFRLFLVHPTKA